MQNNKIKNYLRLPWKNEDGKEMKSPLIAAIIDARKATGRNPDTGKIETRKKSAYWAGAIAYMIAIDHVGKIFARSNRSLRFDDDMLQNRCFLIALDIFTDIEPKHAYALYALRNSFAHDYFLINPNKNFPDLRHVFVVKNDDSALVEITSSASKNSKEFNKTTVNLFEVGELVEDILNTLKELNGKNELMVAKNQDLRFIEYLPN